MSPDKWQEISRIFHSVLEKDSDEQRQDFILEVCGDDEQMRAEVELLLDAYETENSFLDTNEPLPEIDSPSSGLKEGDTIGAFAIERLLGKGGMGEVFLARDTLLDRPVAIKVLPSESQNDGQANKRLIREARAAAALEHPHICTIHEIGNEDSFSYIVMQYAEGNTIAGILEQGPLELGKALIIAEQLAEAIAEAHSHGIVHRDIKPANIVISSSEQAMVLDFGLAKRLSNKTDQNSENSLKSILSQPGLIMGTVSYMSPEQARGLSLDFRTDLWSLGVVLFEMTVGRKPFEGDSMVEKLVAILHHEQTYPDGMDQGLRNLIDSLLVKDREQRNISAGDLIGELRDLRKEFEFEKRLATHVSKDSGSSILNARFLQTGNHDSDKTLVIRHGKQPGILKRISWLNAGLAAAVIALIGFGVLYWRYSSNLAWAKDNVAEVARLADSEDYFAAYDLAQEISGYLPDEKQIVELMPTIADHLSVTSDPSGAKVYIKRFQTDANGEFPERTLVGVTPITDMEIARGHYILQIENEGFKTFERTISGSIPRIGGSFIDSPPIKLETSLSAAKGAPENMVFIPGGKYSLINWSRLSQTEVELEGFYIDKYEVSNSEFKEFIKSGGYQKAEYWKYPFIKNDMEISLGEAAEKFKDKTGLPGPRSWSNQNYAEGWDDLPVTDITWYEAAAYAAFRGKELPSVFQWEKAARDGVTDPRYNAMPWGLIKQGDSTDLRANFSSKGTVPVRQFEFGMSPYGVFNMAGNVSEWVINRSGDNYVTSGGAWSDLPYTFGGYGEYPGFYASSKLGFRCVRNTQNGKSNRGAQDLVPVTVPDYVPSADSSFATWVVHYQYDKKPARAKMIARTETDAWIRETIEFDGENNERVIGYLYLPKNYKGPFQVVHYLPPGDVVRGLRSLTDSVAMFLTPVIKSGRAVFAVELKGYKNRPHPDKYVPPDQTTIEFRKQAVNWITDLRLGLDYLEQRKEIDFNTLSLLGISNGGNLSLLLMPLETRYKSAALVGAGVDERWENWTPEANFINFAPHSGVTKLLVNGRFDETHPFKTFSEPLFKLLKQPKKQVVYDGGHIPSVEFFSTTVNSWFDEEIGKPIKF